MQKYLFGKTDVVRAVSKIIKHLSLQSVVVITISREGVSDYFMEVKEPGSEQT